MIRTYTDILGEYYDNQTDTWEKIREVSVPNDQLKGEGKSNNEKSKIYFRR